MSRRRATTAPRKDRLERESWRIGEIRVLALKSPSGVKGSDPVVINALAVEHFDTQVAQARQARNVSSERRVHGIFSHGYPVAGVCQPDGGVGHAHVGLEAGQDRGT